MKKEALQQALDDVRSLQDKYWRVAGYETRFGDSAIALLQAELDHPNNPHGHCTNPRCKDIFTTYLDEHNRLMKYEPEGGPMHLNKDAP